MSINKKSKKYNIKEYFRLDTKGLRSLESCHRFGFAVNRHALDQLPVMGLNIHGLLEEAANLDSDSHLG